MKKTKSKLDHLDDKDFFVDPRPLTDAEKKFLSEVIAKHKKKNASKRKRAS